MNAPVTPCCCSRGDTLDVNFDAFFLFSGTKAVTIHILIVQTWAVD
jgi:hypothetical protein